MTADVQTADTPLPAPRREWGAALRALRRLLRDKEDTRQVFEIMRALSGDSTGKAYRRLCDTPRGGRYPYAKAIWQGYQRGRKAKWLLAEDYEALFAEPLEQARRRLGITPPTVYDAIPPEARDIIAGPAPAGTPVPAGA